MYFGAYERQMCMAITAKHNRQLMVTVNFLHYHSFTCYCTFHHLSGIMKDSINTPIQNRIPHKVTQDFYIDIKQVLVNFLSPLQCILITITSLPHKFPDKVGIAPSSQIINGFIAYSGCSTTPVCFHISICQFIFSLTELSPVNRRILFPFFADGI